LAETKRKELNTEEDVNADNTNALSPLVFNYLQILTKRLTKEKNNNQPLKRKICYK